MKKLLLTALLCFCVNAYAVEWEKAHENISGDIYYVDVDNIRRHNGFVYYWLLTDYLEPSFRGNYSHIDKYKVDCVEEKKTRLSRTFYSQPMGKGRITDEITERSRHNVLLGMYFVTMSFVCDRAK